MTDSDRRPKEISSRPRQNRRVRREGSAGTHDTVTLQELAVEGAAESYGDSLASEQAATAARLHREKPPHWG